MDHGEILTSSRRDRNARDAFGRRRKCGKECEGQMTDRFAELGAVRTVPGIDGIEVFELRDAGTFDHADQVESGVGDGACAIGKANQRKHRARSPDFGVIDASGFESGQGKNDVADGAGPDEESSG